MKYIVKFYILYGSCTSTHLITHNFIFFSNPTIQNILLHDLLILDIHDKIYKILLLKNDQFINMTIPIV